jgi:hypothetical protein
MEFGKFFNNPICSDLQIILQNDEILYVHKIILFNSTSLFQNIINDCHIVDQQMHITNFLPETVKQVISHIYKSKYCKLYWANNTAINNMKWINAFAENQDIFDFSNYIGYDNLSELYFSAIESIFITFPNLPVYSTEEISLIINTIDRAFSSSLFCS